LRGTLAIPLAIEGELGSKTLDAVGLSGSEHTSRASARAPFHKTL
jgi:hypothetical protein